MSKKTGKPEGRNVLALNVMLWLDTYESGGGLACRVNSEEMGDLEPRMKVSYVGKEPKK